MLAVATHGTLPDQKPTGADATKAWQSKLSAYWVDNLLDDPDFRRYCLPFESSTGLQGQEPGLVISVRHHHRLCPQRLRLASAGGDHSFDSSHHATKISKLGIKFIGYNNTTGTIVALANEPRVYLIPVGHDVMRSPGSTGRPAVVQRGGPSCAAAVPPGQFLPRRTRLDGRL